MKTSYPGTVDWQWNKIGLQRFLFQFVCCPLLSRMLPYMLVFVTNFDQYWFCSSISTLSSMKVMWRRVALCVQGILIQKCLQGEGKRSISQVDAFHLVSHFFGIMFKFKVPHNVLIGKLDLNSATRPLCFCGSFSSTPR